MKPALVRRAPVLLACLAAAVAVALVAAMAGCGGGNPHLPGTLDRADYFAAKGNRLEAVAAYEAFMRHNPTDSLASEAQFRKAMVYMDLKDYPLAAVEFQILRKDYPNSPRVEEGMYQEGLAYRRQVGDLERDASGAYQAREHFQRFKALFPQSARTAAVDAELAQISDLLVHKRLAQAEVFRQLRRWNAVATVLDGILRDEPQSTLADRVLWERARAAEKLRDDAAAAGFYRKLADEHPGSPHAAEAAERAAALGGAQAAAGAGS